MFIGFTDGNHPVGKISEFGDLHGSQNGQIDVTTSNHGKTVIAGEIGSAREDSDGFFASIDEVRILFTGFGERSKTQNAVFALKSHVDAGWNVIAGQHRHTDT